MNNIKKVLAMGCVALCATICMAGHHGWGGGSRYHSYRPHYTHHGHHDSFWGRGGRNFWPGFVGGVVGSVVADTIVSRPNTVVVTTPVVTTPVVTTPVVTTPVVTTPVIQPQVVVQKPITTVQQVWVEGRYVDQVNGNGTIVRVWQPGHWETRTITQ